MAYLLFAFILVIDQLTKFYISSNFLPGESVGVVEPFFHITYVLNPGAAFGMLPSARWFFVLAAAALLAAFLWYHKRLRRQPAAFYYGCVALLAGAVGNLIDRIRQGLVIDFFDFRIWPVFNIADVAIVLGVASMIFAILFRMKEMDD
ncbi:signal peptidase II [Mitsuokella sp.]|uniref:signal peptidase II n=1 Tax=Mitsuokella sp. TaxID=2049034 RepID=UPI003D7E1D51